MISYLSQRLTSLPISTSTQRTPQEIQIRTIVGDSYDETQTPHDNLVNCIRAGTLARQEQHFPLSGFTFHLQDNEELRVPPHIALADCRVTRGKVIYSTGTLEAISIEAQAIFFDANPWHTQPDELRNKISSYLSQEDLNRFSLVNKDMSSSLCSKRMLRVHDWRLHLWQDYRRFVMADHLVRLRQYQRPALYRPEKSYASKGEFFKYLARSCKDLYLFLRAHPDRVNEQDDDGMTILHHAASIGAMMGSNSASLIHQLLFEVPGIDFSIKDLNGNTAVHLAGYFSYDRVTCRYIFPNYVRKAAALGFDFTTRGSQGLTVLHYAALNAYECDMQGRDQNLSTILAILIEHPIPNLAAVMNALSDSGSTALYYSLSRLAFSEVQKLLDAGADPLLCGTSERSPLARIRTFITDIVTAKTELNPDDDQQKILRLDNMLATLTGIEEQIKKSSESKSKTK